MRRASDAHERDAAAPSGPAGRERHSGRRREGEHPDDRACGQRHGLAGEAAAAEHYERREPRAPDDRRPGERPAHREHRQRDDGHGDELKALDPACARDVRLADDERERRHRQRGRQREPDPRREPAEAAGAARPDRDPELARGRSRQEARERDELGELALVEPLRARRTRPEVPDVRDGPAEGRERRGATPPEHLESRSRRPGSC